MRSVSQSLLPCARPHLPWTTVCVPRRAAAEGHLLLTTVRKSNQFPDLQHQAFRLTLDGKLFSAPIPPDVQNVLDVGCGTGIWYFSPLPR